MSTSTELAVPSGTAEVQPAFEFIPTDLNTWTTPKLKAEAKKGFVTAGKHLDSYARHAVRTGVILAALKDRLKHGEYTPWLEKNFSGDPRTAQRYVTMAKQAIELSGANPTHVSCLDIPEQTKKVASVVAESPATEPDEEIVDGEVVEKSEEPARSPVALAAVEDAEPDEDEDEDRIFSILDQREGLVELREGMIDAGDALRDAGRDEVAKLTDAAAEAAELAIQEYDAACAQLRKLVDLPVAA